MRASRAQAAATGLRITLACSLILLVLLAPNDLSRLTPSTFVRIPLEAVLGIALLLMLPEKVRSVGALLFGVGLAIQFDRLADNPGRFVLLLRRLIVLLAIGAVHLFLIWNGDILVEYAVAGLLVLPFLFAPRWLVLIAAAATLLLFLTMPFLSVVRFPSDVWIWVHVAGATRAYTRSFMILVDGLWRIPALWRTPGQNAASVSRRRRAR